MCSDGGMREKERESQECEMNEAQEKEKLVVCAPWQLYIMEMELKS